MHISPGRVHVVRAGYEPDSPSRFSFQHDMMCFRFYWCISVCSNIQCMNSNPVSTGCLRGLELNFDLLWATFIGRGEVNPPRHVFVDKFSNIQNHKYERDHSNLGDLQLYSCRCFDFSLSNDSFQVSQSNHHEITKETSLLRHMLYEYKWV